MGHLPGLPPTGASSVVNVPELDVSSPSLQKFVTVGNRRDNKLGLADHVRLGALTMQGVGTINVQSLTDVDKSLFSADLPALAAPFRA